MSIFRLDCRLDSGIKALYIGQIGGECRLVAAADFKSVEGRKLPW